MPVDPELPGSVRMIPVLTDGSSAPPQPNTTRIWGPAPAGNVLIRPKLHQGHGWEQHRPCPKLQGSLENFQLNLVSLIHDQGFLELLLAQVRGRSLIIDLLQPFLHPSPLSQGFNHAQPIPEAPRNCWRIYLFLSRTYCPSRVGAAGTPHPSKGPKNSLIQTFFLQNPRVCRAGRNSRTCLAMPSMHCHIPAVLQGQLANSNT